MLIENLDEEREMIRTFVRQLTTRYGRDYWVERAKADGTVEEMWQEMGKAGYLGVTIPEEYGGSGLSMQRLAVLMEELSNEGVPLLFLVVSTAMASICIAKHASEEQKRRYLPKLASGEEKFCFAITEPNAGSNSFKIQTIARRDGDHYTVNGQKIFITGSDEADHMLLVARTIAAKDARDKREGMALFVVDPKASGIEQQRIDTKILAPERQYQIFFDDVKIPLDARVGHDELGLKPLFDALNPERIVIAALGAGLGRFALKKAVEYCKTRTVFDRPIGSHQGLSHPLAIAKTHIELASLMTHEAARVFDAGGDAGEKANMAKFAAAEAALEAIDAAIQVHGGMGFTGDVDVITLWPLARLLRTAPVSREMVLNYVAEHVLGLPRSY